MPTTNRRNILRAGLAFFALPGTAFLHLGCSSKQEGGSHDGKTPSEKSSPVDDKHRAKGDAMKIHYLEIVTPEVDAACTLYSQMYGVKFGEADPKLGGARTAEMAGGGKLGVRGPLRETEKPVVRPYVLVEDIKASVAAAEKAGGQIAMPPTEIPGYGQFAIVVHGGIESGLWQV